MNIRVKWIPVITARRVLVLRVEKMMSRYREQLRVYRISSRGQPTRGGPPAWAFEEGLRAPHRKKKAYYKIQVEIFWAVMPRGVVVGYRRFGGPCCLHLHPTPHGVTNQKTSA